MPNAGIGEGLLSSPRQLAGDQGVIKMPEAIELDEMDTTPRASKRRTVSAFNLVSPRPDQDVTPGEAFMLKFSRMSTHLGARAYLLRRLHVAINLFTSPFLCATGVASRSAANERTLLAWLRTSAAFFSIGLAFAKIDQFQDDVVSVSFVSVGILTFIVGCIRYYQVKTVLETKDSDFQYALRMFSLRTSACCACTFICLSGAAYRGCGSCLRRTAQGFKRLGAGKMLSAAVLAFSIAATCLLYQSFREIASTGVHYTGAGAGTSNSPAPAPDAQLQVLQQILTALNAQNGPATGGGDQATGGG
jgi:uncharacterized membrane protein YidH (DUF202 family)